MSCIYVEDTKLTSLEFFSTIFMDRSDSYSDHNTVEEPLCWREIEVAWVALDDYIRATAFLPRGSNDEKTGTHRSHNGTHLLVVFFLDATDTFKSVWSSTDASDSTYNIR